MTSMPSEFMARLSERANTLEQTLNTLLSLVPLPGELARPSRLLEAMRYAVLGGGKRLRPFLLVETAALLGCHGDGVLRTAAALEFVHCYSLVHDDLPAMDDDDTRRGRPSLHRAFDQATAILAGDSLLTYAFDVLADASTHPSGAVRAELVLGLARAGGLGGMAGGQMLDLEAEGRYDGGRPLAMAPDDVRRLQAMKTGALLAYSVEAGAIMAQASERERRDLRSFGQALGAAFQVADDILDVVSDQDAIGKAAGKDAGRGKATLVGLFGLEAAMAERDRLAMVAIEALAGFDGRANILRHAARFAAERRS